MNSVLLRDLSSSDLSAIKSLIYNVWEWNDLTKEEGV